MSKIVLKNSSHLRCELCGDELETKARFIHHIKVVHQARERFRTQNSDETSDDRPRLQAWNQIHPGIKNGPKTVDRTVVVGLSQGQPEIKTEPINENRSRLQLYLNPNPVRIEKNINLPWIQALNFESPQIKERTSLVALNLCDSSQSLINAGTQQDCKRDINMTSKIFGRDPSLGLHANAVVPDSSVTVQTNHPIQTPTHTNPVARLKSLLESLNKVKPLGSEQIHPSERKDANPKNVENTRTTRPDPQGPQTESCEKVGILNVKNDQQNKATPIKKRNKHRFYCCGCNQRFRGNVDLIAHMKTAHSLPTTEEKKLKCARCHERFLDPDTFLRHHKEKCPTSSSSLPKYWCLFCTKLWKHQSEALVHMKANHGESYQIFVCQDCKLAFESYELLLNHVMYDHEMIKSMKCPECSVCFTTGLGLKLHMDAHSKRYECNACKEKFRFKASLNYHVRQKHLDPSTVAAVVGGDRKDDLKAVSLNQGVSNGLGKIGIKKLLPQAVSKLENERVLCDVCNKTFQGLPALAHHFITGHPDQHRLPLTGSYVFGDRPDSSKSVSSNQGDSNGLGKVAVKKLSARVIGKYEKDRVLCSKCDETFQDLPAMVHHFRVSHPDQLRLSDQSILQQATTTPVESQDTFNCLGNRNSNGLTTAGNQDVVKRTTVEKVDLINID